MQTEPADTRTNKTGNAKRLAGKYRNRIPEHLKGIDYSQAREEAIIPREYELEGSEAIIRCEGARLIIEPVSKPTLLEVLVSLEPLDESFPEIDDLPLDDVEL